MDTWTALNYNTPITVRQVWTDIQLLEYRPQQRHRAFPSRCPIPRHPIPVSRPHAIHLTKSFRATDMDITQNGTTSKPVASPSMQGLRTVFDDDEIFVFDSIESAVKEIADGRFVVVLDDANRENEGDLVAAADRVTAQSIAFMVEHTSGVICVGMEGHDLDRLRLPLMVPPSENTDAKRTAFTITVDLRAGTTTGISASDRAKTLNALADPDMQSTDFRRPGHIFPLRYEEGGVLKRRGHTEASVDLARLAGSHPAGVLCEIVDRSDGSMARTPQLFEFARRYGLKIITIEDLAQYLAKHKRTWTTNTV